MSFVVEPFIRIADDGGAAQCLLDSNLGNTERRITYH